MVDVPGSIPGSSLSSLTVGGMPINAVLDALAVNQQQASGQRSPDEHQFWSSTPRPLLDDTHDIFEVRLSQTHRVNSISFELANFPFQAELHHWDEVAQAWAVSLGVDGNPIILTNTTSVPSVISTLVQQQSTEHPFHRGNGHWLKFELEIGPTLAGRFRLVLSRPDGTPPVDGDGNALAYPHGVRRFNLGYRITKRGHVPHTAPHPHYPGWRQQIDSSHDLFGSTVSYSLRENRAADLLNGGIWKSEPQPVSNAVVNFYVDLRDAVGDAQVLDRVALDPLYSGTSLNLYYSNDDLGDDFQAEVLPQGYFDGVGTVVADDSGLVFPNQMAWVDVENRHIQFSPHRSWWMGLRHMPQYDYTDSTTYSVFDFGVVSLTVTAGVHTLNFLGATATLSTTFQVNMTQSVVLSYDGSGTMALSVLNGLSIGETVSVTVTNPPTLHDAPELLRFFGSHTSSFAGNSRLLNVMIKNGLPATVDFSAFGGSQGFLDAYCNPPEFIDQDTGSTLNSPLRMAFQQIVSGRNETGFIGGPPAEAYADLTWTPINRDYKAAKGVLDFPAIKAKFLNLEFTNLAPEPYEHTQLVTRKVRLFHPEWLPIPTRRYGHNRGGLRINIAIAAQNVFSFGDFAHLTPPSLPLPAGGFTRTEVYYSTDPAATPKLRNINILYGMQHWRPLTRAARHFRIGVHEYLQTTVEHDTRMAYFCGLTSLKVFRTRYVTNDDTRQYEELFHDRTHIDSVSGWVFSDNDVSTPPDQGFSSNIVARMTGKTFASQRKVIGVQFAAAQSPPTQLLADADFNTFNSDGTQNLDQWSYVGDVSVTPWSGFDTDIGTTVRVQRTVPGTIYFGQGLDFSSGTYVPYDALAHTWGGIEVNYQYWNILEEHAPELSWADLAGVRAQPASAPATPTDQIVGTPLLGGIQTKRFTAPSRAGRLYAAARVLAPAALKVPLWLQIISSRTDQFGQPVVLAEEPYNVASGTAEWYVGYTIGTGEVDQNYEVGVRLVQKYATGDVWFVDSIALFEESIVWEFSNDGGSNFYPAYEVRNDPNGVFIFPPSSDPNPDDTVGRSLVWRVSGYRGDLHVNSLAIRPWYDSFRGPVPCREIVQTTAPQASDYDNYPPITMDPHWRLWHKPIPMEWWFFYRQWLLLRPDTITISALPPVFAQDMLMIPVGNPPVFLVDSLSG
jgi:hypothetical protein